MDLGSLGRFGRMCVLIAAVCFPLPGIAGEIEGVVFESWSIVSPPLERLSGVKVRAKLGNGSFVDAIGMTTNNDGAYRIVDLPEEVVEVHFSCDGFLEKPTIERNVEVKKGAVTKRDAALTSVKTQAGFFQNVADSVARTVADDYKTGYQKLWVTMYQTNIPVTQKPDFAKALVSRDSRVIEAVPQIAQYLEVDRNKLLAASNTLTEVFHSQEFDAARDSEELRTLPPAVYVDLVTRAAKNSLKYESDEATMRIFNKLNQGLGDNRLEALQNVMTIRLKGDVPKKSPFDSISNPK